MTWSIPRSIPRSLPRIPGPSSAARAAAGGAGRSGGRTGVVIGWTSRRGEGGGKLYAQRPGGPGGEPGCGTVAIETASAAKEGILTQHHRLLWRLLLIGALLLLPGAA